MELQSFYLPDNLDLQSLLLQHNKPQLIKHLDKFHWFISLLYVKKFIDKRYSELEHFEKKRIKRIFMPVHSAKLKKVLTKRLYKEIIDTCVELQIVEVDNKYMPKEKTKSYRLASVYHNGVTYKKVACQNLQFNDKLVELKKREWDGLSMVHKKILQNMYRYQFDVQQAEQILDSLEISTHAYISAKVCIDKIVDREFFFTVSPQTGRLFHNFCNLKKELRCCLRDAENLPLVDIDVANSQPFFLSAILKDAGLDSVDTEHFQKLCQTGLLYDYIANFNGLTRKYVKEQMLTLFFCKNHWQFKMKDIFIEEFPVVYDAIAELKNDNNADLAILLQKVEAEIMIDTIAPILIEKDIKFITVHDSFLVSQTNVETVNAIMQDCFQKKYGIVPMIRTK